MNLKLGTPFLAQGARSDRAPARILRLGETIRVTNLMLNPK